MMITPPMVGVPALAWCVEGPSSRINCPRERWRRKRIQRGVRSSAQRKPTPPDSIKLNISSPQQLQRYDAIVEFSDHVTDRLGGLVTLAGDHDHVPGCRRLDRHADRTTAIGLSADDGTRRDSR